MLLSMKTAIRTSGQLGPVLRALRQAQGLTQSALGQRLGLSQERMSAIERVPETITVQQLITVLMALDAELAVVPRTPPAAESQGDW
jgi:HTH-type transcriptional regulator/antitoxin HipB